jgi:hypothetical protein
MMDKQYIRRLVEQVINEVAEQNLLNATDMKGVPVSQLIDNAHRILNNAQRTLMMNGGSDSEMFQRVNQCDNLLLDLLNGR